MQAHELLYILHLVHRKPKTGEDFGHHSGTYDLVAVESPAHGRVKALAGSLAYIVQQGGPAEPEKMIPAFLGPDILPAYIVKHGQTVLEVILMTFSVNSLHPFQCLKFGEDVMEQSGAVHKAERNGRTVAHEHLAELVGNPLPRQDIKPGSHSAHRFH